MLERERKWGSLELCMVGDGEGLNDGGGGRRREECEDGGGCGCCGWWKVVVMGVGVVVLGLMKTAGVLSEIERGSPKAKVERA